ncbi:hypothetical protein SK128_025681 [Halocaridina rubra]|uniref:Uncharacterized protein n=1 Tax=Halocaridina rubra TaxID=373956 RepID=A0AAN8WP67_HALRR
MYGDFGVTGMRHCLNSCNMEDHLNSLLSSPVRTGNGLLKVTVTLEFGFNTQSHQQFGLGTRYSKSSPVRMIDSLLIAIIGNGLFKVITNVDWRPITQSLPVRLGNNIIILKLPILTGDSLLLHHQLE